MPTRRTPSTQVTHPLFLLLLLPLSFLSLPSAASPSSQDATPLYPHTHPIHYALSASVTLPLHISVLTALAHYLLFFLSTSCYLFPTSPYTVFLLISPRSFPLMPLLPALLTSPVLCLISSLLSSLPPHFSDLLPLLSCRVHCSGRRGFLLGHIELGE